MAKDYSNFKTRYNGVKGLVDNVLKDHPNTRNSYERLVAKVWESHGVTITGDLSKVPSIETINRARRDLKTSYPLPPGNDKQQGFFRDLFGGK